MCEEEKKDYYADDEDDEKEDKKEWEIDIMNALTLPDEENDEENAFYYVIWFPNHKSEREVIIDERRLKIIGLALAILSLEFERADIESELGRELKEYFAEVSEKREEAYNIIDAMLEYAKKSLFELARRGYDGYNSYEEVVIDYNATINAIVEHMINFEEVIIDALDLFLIPDVTDMWDIVVHEEAQKLYEKKLEDAPRLGMEREIKVDEEQFLMWADDFEEKLKEWESLINKFKEWFFINFRRIDDEKEDYL